MKKDDDVTPVDPALASPPPPRASPQPGFSPDLPEETPSALHRVRVRELNWLGAKLTIAMVVAAIGTAFGAYRVILSEALAQTDAGVKVHEERITTLEHQQVNLQSDVHEVQVDLRSLYKAVLTGQRQERLEKPPPEHKDAGSP